MLYWECMDDSLSKNQNKAQVTPKLAPTAIRTVQGSAPPAVVPRAKEVEKIETIQRELGEIAKEKERKEVEPGVERVEVKEIPLPEEVVAEVPPELKELGVEPIIPPTVPEELQPKVQVVALPATQTQVKTGLAQPLVNSVRWWATLIFRLLQKTGGGVRYVLKKLGRDQSSQNES